MLRFNESGSTASGKAQSVHGADGLRTVAKFKTGIEKVYIGRLTDIVYIIHIAVMHSMY